MKVVICGNYGATNLGDEAILDGILSIIANVDPTAVITVLSANPEETSTRHNVKSEYLLPCGPRSLIRGILGGHIGRTFKGIQECDAFILGGGGLLGDEKMMAMVIWPLQAAFASLLRKPIFCLGQSVGPLRTFFGRMMAGNVFKKALSATVRDSKSQQLLHSLGVSMPTVLADPAFCVHVSGPLDSKRENLVFLSLRGWRIKESVAMYKYIAQLIVWIWSEYGLKTILVPFSEHPENDTSVLNNILVQVEKPEAAEVLEYSGDYRKVIQLMSRCKAVIGMRLHSLIFATMTQTPFMALSYSEKVRNLTTDLEMDRYTFDWGKVDLDELQTGFKRLMEDYDGTTLNLGAKNLLMRAKAHEHEELLRTFFNAAKKPE